MPAMPDPPLPQIQRPFQASLSLRSCGGRRPTTSYTPTATSGDDGSLLLRILPSSAGYALHLSFHSPWKQRWAWRGVEHAGWPLPPPRPVGSSAAATSVLVLQLPSRALEESAAVDGEGCEGWRRRCGEREGPEWMSDGGRGVGREGGTCRRTQT
ncbi:hypothetical protein U9M48_008883 [Paspalum notatum var. saurae]|uniref:Uncharacterized protein n=1 Tax=Paspalum notatum var. saurae TaxID=547442 RepID=A0AAQ3SPX3_PASNO